MEVSAGKSMPRDYEERQLQARQFWLIETCSCPSGHVELICEHRYRLHLYMFTADCGQIKPVKVARISFSPVGLQSVLKYAGGIHGTFWRLQRKPHHQRAPDSDVKHLCIFAEQLQQTRKGTCAAQSAGIPTPWSPVARVRPSCTCSRRSYACCACVSQA